jgi:hypothetical protein
MSDNAKPPVNYGNKAETLGLALSVFPLYFAYGKLKSHCPRLPITLREMAWTIYQFL